MEEVLRLIVIIFDSKINGGSIKVDCNYLVFKDKWREYKGRYGLSLN